MERRFGTAPIASAGRPTLVSSVTTGGTARPETNLAPTLLPMPDANRLAALRRQTPKALADLLGTAARTQPA